MPRRIVRLALGLGLGALRLRAQTVSVDASPVYRHPISPLIYGVAYAPDASTLLDLNATLNRLGGNPTSRYNWQSNVDNRAADYYFESIPYLSSTPGEVGDSFISLSKAGGAKPLVTIPMLDWVAKPGPGRSKLASFSILKYGAQTGHDPFFADAGTGIRLDGSYVTGNDPNDANTPADSSFQQAWAQHLVATWGTAGSGGLSHYLLDNEPSIWFSTHRDVHPVGPTMQEVRDKTVDYATKIKATDPGAVVFGPEEWGWSGYFYSGYDQQYGALNGWTFFPDRTNHGGADYLPWYLGQLRDASTAAGRRLLDYFSVHYYPQGGEFSNDTLMATQLLRNQSTRALWDPNYIDQSWINDKVQLVPRLKDWVNTNYPGTRIALTEYNWGAEGHINGATAQADILGILGREEVDLATRWTTPDATTPTYKAMKMYRNYDGNRSTFGDTGVRALVTNPDVVSAFAALRASDGALTVMVVSKSLSGTTPLTITMAGFGGARVAQVWQLTAGNAITRLADVTVSANVLSTSVPSPSITLFVVAAGGSFYTVTPCRVLDTRNADSPLGGPALAGAADRVFVVASQCGIPPSATAVCANLAVTAPSSGGHLTVYPKGASPPVVSAINFSGLQTRANNAILPLGPAGDIVVHCGMSAGETVHFILDVTGYFQ